MIKFENVVTPSNEQWLAVIRGMRNPLASWDKMDSKIVNGNIEIGENDLSLMRRLCNAGSEHRKFMRMLYVIVDITAPDAFFTQFDTYKVGVTVNSTSFMHKGVSKPFTRDMFTIDDKFLIDEDLCPSRFLTVDSITFSDNTDKINTDNADNTDIEIDKRFHTIQDDWLEYLEWLRQQYLATKDKRYWRLLVNCNPRGFNYTRTVCMNYETISLMYKQRKGHKLAEWNEFCEWVETLPYMKELIIG